MKGLLFKIWNRVHSGFWFIPTVMAGGALILAFVGVNVDVPLTQWLSDKLDWTFTGGADGASAVMGIIAGSMITIAGVVFSMTLVALSLASSQLGPRLLRSFMSDTNTQVVLGTFVATFLYCLIVLRSIRHAEADAFVPHLSVTLGVILAVASVGVFIYFIHHVSVSIQANEIAARIGGELHEGIGRLFPERAESGETRAAVEAPDPDFLAGFDRNARPVGADGDGYLQFIDVDALRNLAREDDLVIRVERKPGHYVVADSALATVTPGTRVDDELRARVNAVFVLGNQRTTAQDVEFGVNQLVEIAVRALSPGVNDPFTAITCIDHLGSALSRLAVRDVRSPYHRDDENRLRVMTLPDSFPDILDVAFNQIRQHSRSSAAVTIRLLETIAVVAQFAHRSGDRAALLRHAEMIARGARDGIAEDNDRAAVDERFQAVVKLCGEPV